MQRVGANSSLRATRHRFSKVAWAPRSFEGRHLITELKSELETADVDVVEGSWLIPMDQSRARLIAQLLEPDAPDSFIRWGFFDSIFEEKEYAEERVMERIAREMLAKDAALKAEFEQRLTDPAFAADANARLRFFYQRSPYFDQAHNRYPVLRLDGAAVEKLSR